MRFLDAFKIGNQRINLIRAEHKHRHVGVTDNDPFGECFFEISHRVVFGQLPEGFGILMRAVTGRPDRVTGGAACFRDQFANLDLAVIGKLFSVLFWLRCNSDTFFSIICRRGITAKRPEARSPERRKYM